MRKDSKKYWVSATEATVSTAIAKYPVPLGAVRRRANGGFQWQPGIKMRKHRRRRISTLLRQGKPEKLKLSF